MANFEDTGHYYASEEMQKDFLVLSMNSGLIYDTKDILDVKLIKKTTDEFYAIAKESIDIDDRCYYGKGSIYSLYTDTGRTLSWEF